MLSIQAEQLKHRVFAGQNFCPSFFNHVSRIAKTGIWKKIEQKRSSLIVTLFDSPCNKKCFDCSWKFNEFNGLWSLRSEDQVISLAVDQNSMYGLYNTKQMEFFQISSALSDLDIIVWTFWKWLQWKKRTRSISFCCCLCLFFVANLYRPLKLPTIPKEIRTNASEFTFRCCLRPWHSCGTLTLFTSGVLVCLKVVIVFSCLPC